MTRNPSPAEIGGMDPRQDAPEISQMPNKEHSQQLTPDLGAGSHPKGSSIQKPPIEGGYDPLHYCPTRLKAHHRRAAERAAEGSYLKAIKLKCLDCMGWEYGEAKRCDTFTCALWIMNKRVFPAQKRKERSAA